MSATNCTRCGTLYDARGDAADEPGRLCPACWRRSAPRPVSGGRRMTVAQFLAAYDAPLFIRAQVAPYYAAVFAPRPVYDQPDAFARTFCAGCVDN